MGFLYSFEVLKGDDYDIILVEKYPCNDKYSLENKETEYIKCNECVNKNLPKRSTKEYYQDRKEYFSKINKDYRENNKEEIAKNQKYYRAKNLDKLNAYKKDYDIKNSATIKYKEKIYRKVNEDRIKGYAKIYREKNREELDEKMKANVECTCGKSFTLRNKARHLKSKFHQSKSQLDIQEGC